MIISDAVLEGKKVLPHGFATHTAQDGAERAQILQLDGGRAGDYKQEMDRQSILRSEFDPFTADAQGNMHLVNAQDLPMGYSNPMANSRALDAFTTKHASFEAFYIR